MRTRILEEGTSFFALSKPPGTRGLGFQLGQNYQGVGEGVLCLVGGWRDVV